MVSTDARPGVRSTFGPVSLAYESELKVVFRRGQGGRLRVCERLGGTAVA